MKNSRETKALLTKNNCLQPALHRTTGSSRIQGNNSCFFLESQESYFLCLESKVS